MEEEGAGQWPWDAPQTLWGTKLKSRWAFGQDQGWPCRAAGTPGWGQEIPPYPASQNPVLSPSSTIPRLHQMGSQNQDSRGQGVESRGEETREGSGCCWYPEHTANKEESSVHGHVQVPGTNQPGHSVEGESRHQACPDSSSGEGRVTRAQDQAPHCLGWSPGLICELGGGWHVPQFTPHSAVTLTLPHRL